jgi:hypothetical protein
MFPVLLRFAGSVHINFRGTKMRYAGFAFIAIGIAFIGLGASGQRTFFFVGIAFLVIGFLQLLRTRRR